MIKQKGGTKVKLQQSNFVGRSLRLRSPLVSTDDRILDYFSQIFRILESVLWWWRKKFSGGASGEKKERHKADQRAEGDIKDPIRTSGKCRGWRSYITAHLVTFYSQNVTAGSTWRLWMPWWTIRGVFKNQDKSQDMTWFDFIEQFFSEKILYF